MLVACSLLSNTAQCWSLDHHQPAGQGGKGQDGARGRWVDEREPDPNRLLRKDGNKRAAEKLGEDGPARSTTVLVGRND